MTVFIVASVDAAITCGTVASSLSPCLGYLSKGGVVPPPCCAGVKKLNGMAQTTPDRQQACRCLQSAAKGVNPSLASGLPGKCGVSIPAVLFYVYETILFRQMMSLFPTSLDGGAVGARGDGIGDANTEKTKLN